MLPFAVESRMGTSSASKEGRKEGRKEGETALDKELSIITGPERKREAAEEDDDERRD